MATRPLRRPRLTMFSGSGDQPVTATLQGSSTFVSDCTVAVAAAESAAFDSIIAVEQKQTAAPAENLAETQAADFFAAATEAIGTLNEGDLLWLHFSGLSSAWDSPIELREQYRAMDDPEPYADVNPPNHPFAPEKDDPDLLVAIQQACFAQVVVIDRMLGIFLEHLDQHPTGKSADVLIAGVRGYCLGEHEYVGIANDLFAQSLHVPLLVKLSDDNEPFQNRRSHELIQTSLIGDWIGNAKRAQDHCAIIVGADSQPLIFNSGQHTAVQTTAWKFLRQVDKDGIVSEQLFAKPDDRWEVNDVARRCPQIVEDMNALLEDAS